MQYKIINLELSFFFTEMKGSNRTQEQFYQLGSCLSVYPTCTLALGESQHKHFSQ